MHAESSSIPPRIKNTPSLLGLFAGTVMVFAVLGVAAVVFFFNPSAHGFYPICLFHQLTGLNCPGCGGTRALYALLHGHWQLAIKDNALFVVLLAAAVPRGIWFAARQIQRKPAASFLPAKFLWALLVIAVVFAVMRNLPWFVFLSP